MVFYHEFRCNSAELRFLFFVINLREGSELNDLLGKKSCISS